MLLIHPPLQRPGIAPSSRTRVQRRRKRREDLESQRTVGRWTLLLHPLGESTHLQRLWGGVSHSHNRWTGAWRGACPPTGTQWNLLYGTYSTGTARQWIARSRRPE